MSSRNFKILAIEHIGIATFDNSLNKFLTNILGFEDVYVEEIEGQDVITEIYNTGKGKLELLKATSNNSPISKFLNKKGQSVHHIALRVDNLDNAIMYMENKKIKLIDRKSRIGAEGYSTIFIHPHSTPGILIELCQKNN